METDAQDFQVFSNFESLVNGIQNSNQGSRWKYMANKNYGQRTAHSKMGEIKNQG